MGKKRSFRVPKSRKVIRSKKLKIKPPRKNYSKQAAFQKKTERRITKTLIGLVDTFSSRKTTESEEKEKAKVTSYKPSKPKARPVKKKSFTSPIIHTPKFSFWQKLSDTYPHRVLKKNRVGIRKWYGPYPNPLGVRKILHISISDKGIKFLTENSFDSHYLNLVKHIITDAMMDLWTKIYNYGQIQVNRYVPMDTGDLRKSIMKSLSNNKREGSYVPDLNETDFKKIKLEIRIFSPLIYAGIVNNMPNQILRHPSSIHSSGMKGRTGKSLNDPYALKGFFSMITKNIKMMFKNRYLRAFLKEIEDVMTDMLKTQLKLVNRGIYEAEIATRNSIDYRERQAAKKVQAAFKEIQSNIRTSLHLNEKDKKHRVSYNQARSMFKITT